MNPEVRRDLATAIFNEFQRITGSASRSHFACWIQEEALKVMHAQCPQDPARAERLWHGHGELGQRQLLLEHLRGRPMDQWPSVELAVARAFSPAWQRYVIDMALAAGATR